LIDRFSTDVDIAVINVDEKSGNQIKTLLRNVEKEITIDLVEINVKGLSSKGSRFRKTVYQYTDTIGSKGGNDIIVELNSFANPFPYELKKISSFIYDFLQSQNRLDIIEQYELKTFDVNVLKKEQTLIEKLVSLIRFSFDSDPVESLEQKIRHFYDLYFLAKDEDCKTFISSESFKEIFYKILEHDKQTFDDPKNWADKAITDSVLIKDFDQIWLKLAKRYNQELSVYAYSATIPEPKDIAKEFKILIGKII